MGLETAGAVALGGAALGAAGGILAGASGTPEQRQYTDQTSTRTFAPMSAEQQQLQQQSLQNYLQQQALAQQYEQGIGGAQGYQTAAQQAGLGILGGQAFQLTPQEQAAINARQQAIVSQSQADVQNLLNQNLQQLQGSAASRGVRGQALSQLQTGALRAGAEQLGNASRAAALQAAQEQTQLPLQRIAAQQGQINQGLTLADQMRLQAQQNRIAAQNPFLLQMMQNERLQGGTTRTSGTNVTPGQEGSFMGALTGGLMGAAGGANVGANLMRGFGAMSGSSSTPAASTSQATPNYSLSNNSYWNQNPYRS